ncbi:metallophosphoesterase family protein [Streptomyces sp. NBC_01795]|uniref:purple acid phosphatase family protein n=1 Tax=unclassified Streptomyces TaxID=2593676 RepID=UPI002DD9C490|nr:MULTISPECIES: metallophosphoesterase family protein [unclassified Streptomyces]WSA92162.1 metallophosphoesterase family protein [Streptomyces sp. NBC_01795]WSB76527.1 metallophosphoesterase family protein [Streptomyces sp. NBC_01775]
MTANDLPAVGIPARLAARMSMPEQHAYLREKLSRREKPSRRGVLRGGGLVVAGAAGAAGLVSASEAALGDGPGAAAGPTLVASPVKVDGSLVAPFGRHLAFGSDPKTRMRISWQVPFAVKRPYVRVGLKPWELGRRIEAEVRPLHTPSLGRDVPEVEQLYLHAALDGLRPGTTYYYGVGHDGFDPASAERLGTVGSFTTAPADAGERFVFTAFGDQGVSYDALANDQLLLGQNPAFHLHAGDICYADDSGHGKESDTYDARVWDQFLAQTESVAARVPWMVTTGNHDMEAWYSPNGYGGQSARWSLPDNGPDPEKAPGVYSFRYGNVGVVALDANDVSYEIPANRGYTDGAQTRWLARELKRLRAADGGDRGDGAADRVDFIVVFFHHCAYSTSTHASDGGVRDEWVALFEQHRVDLVVNGHNHVYERTDPVRGGEPTRKLEIGGTTEPRRDGTVYVTAGGAGKKLYDFPVPDSYEGHLDERESVPSFHWTKARVQNRDHVEWSRVRYTGFSFLAVESRPGGRPSLEVTALAESGRRIDHFVVRHG